MSAIKGHQISRTRTWQWQGNAKVGKSAEGGEELTWNRGNVQAVCHTAQLSFALVRPASPLALMYSCISRSRSLGDDSILSLSIFATVKRSFWHCRCRSIKATALMSYEARVGAAGVVIGSVEHTHHTACKMMNDRCGGGHRSGRVKKILGRPNYRGKAYASLVSQLRHSRIT